MNQHSYHGESDLKLLQEFNAKAIAVTDHCGYLHPGDIPHHIYNGNKGYDPAELLNIWKDDQGVAAWLLVNVRFKSFDAQIRPDLRGGVLEKEVLEIAYESTVDKMRKYEIESDKVYADSFQGDTARVQLLKSLGWKSVSTQPYVLNKTKIGDIKVPALPDGFSYRSARSVKDASALAEIHNAAFGSIWTPELYQYVMESPGYEPERELLIEAPDDTFVSFAVTWYDDLNKMGLFEPVGTHKDYQRQGFGRAIMLFGLKRMVDAGMKYASVAHFGDNKAAHGLYQSLGFTPWHLLDEYSKPFFS